MWLRALASIVAALLCVVGGSALGLWADDELWSNVLLGVGTVAGLIVLVLAAVRTSLGGLNLAALIFILFGAAVIIAVVALLGDMTIQCQDFDNCPFN
jgi:hypothetical protein